MHGGRIIFKDGRGNCDKKKSIRCNGGVLEDQMIDPSLHSAQYSDKYISKDNSQMCQSYLHYFYYLYQLNNLYHLCYLYCLITRSSCITCTFYIYFSIDLIFPCQEYLTKYFREISLTQQDLVTDYVTAILCCMN